MAENDHANAAKKHADDSRKKLATEREAREARNKATKEGSEGIKPTPTQEENDLAAMGVHLAEHDQDGSPVGEPDQKQDKDMKAKPGAGYSTRSATPST